MNKRFAKLISIILIAVISLSITKTVYASADELGLSSGDITDWNICKDEESYYITFTGISSGDWDKDYLTNHPVSISYDNGYMGANSIIQFTYSEEIKNGWYQSIDDGSVEINKRKLVNGLTANDVVVCIPKSFLMDDSFIITLNNKTVQSEDIENKADNSETDENTGDTSEDNTGIQNNEEGSENSVSGVFNGIIIDGEFDDWTPVVKTEAGGMTSYQDFLRACAVVSDSEYVYVYIEDFGIGSATWSGPNNNGRFAFVSDLGMTTMFQLKSEGNGSSVSINGIDGATCAYKTGTYGSSGYWEVAVPISALPKNKGTYTFGYYQAEPFIVDLVDSSKTDEDLISSEFGGIVYDGLYGDWTYYPHTRIDYATAGTTDRFVDGEAALYSDGDILFGHCVTKMSAQVSQRGEEMTEGVILRVNRDLQMGLRFVAVDEFGNINWKPDVNSLTEGTYEFYIVDNEGWSSAKTVDELASQGNDLYGKMKLTIKSDTDECEFYLDVAKLAKKFKLDTHEFQIFEVMYQRIGHRWVQTAGVSTNPALGIALCLGVVFIGAYIRKKKGYRLPCESC